MITPSLTQEITLLHAEFCSALADPRRILILYALKDHPYSVSDLAVDLGISQPAASRHLNILRNCGMVRSQRDGQSVVYSLADDRAIQALDTLRSMLADKLRSQGELANSVLEQHD